MTSNNRPDYFRNTIIIGLILSILIIFTTGSSSILQGEILGTIFAVAIVPVVIWIFSKSQGYSIASDGTPRHKGSFLSNSEIRSLGFQNMMIGVIVVLLFFSFISGALGGFIAILIEIIRGLSVIALISILAYFGLKYYSRK